MSQFNHLKNSVSPDQSYFDLTVSNIEGENSKPIAFNYNESRSTPFLDKPEDYWLSILRFSSDTTTLPVFLPTIKQNSPDLDDTIYSVTLEWSSVESRTPDIVSQKFVKWLPQDKSAEVPLAPALNVSKLQNNSTGFYNCYNYSFFILQIYRALEQAYAEISAMANTTGAILPSPYAPIVNWDSTNNQIIVYADEAGYDLDAGNWTTPFNPIKIYFNSALYGLFSSLPASILGFKSPVTLGRNMLLGVVNVGDTNLQSIIPKGTTTPYKAICLYQETSTVANMSPITAIVFTSTTLPIQSSQVSTPITYYNGVAGFNGTNADVANVLTDLATEDMTYRPNIVYTPNSQYRLITLYGNSPISNLDIQIYYRLKDGSLQPMLLGAGGCVTVKLAFLKKSSYVGK